ncbi:hypothetical protein AB0P05_45610 [Streptomyces flaveolus]|uniref:hypothetical protein n=1 Tax=Streptomyces flaveolus TaxID=67297 RepID=UPI00341B58B6
MATSTAAPANTTVSGAVSTGRRAVQTGPGLADLLYKSLYNLPPQAGPGKRNRRSGQVVKGR